ncbi:MAG: FHA domain-containing protein [Archangiaceae bacterium]|nr:FHA domain-containing protein [Archangiaceae bacterium]
MGVPAYMLSILHRQQLLLKDGFVIRYPLDWLVWEPGPWRPAHSVLESNLESTQQPAKEQQRPTGTDAICFQLKLPAQGIIKVGRATTNDLVINDLTASREQFALRHDANHWVLVGPHAPMFVDGERAKDVHPLKSGSGIVLGSVHLTLLSAADMMTRASAYKAATK